MAINPIQFLVASNASILDGSKTISISGNVDCSRVYSGTAVFLGGTDNPAEAVSGTSPDGNGVSTITLRNNWSQGDVSNQPLVSFNTNEGLAEAISNVREIVSNVSAIEDLATQGLIKRIDDNTYEVVSVTSLGESLVGANDAGTARSVLGLGSAATKDVGTSSGNVMEVGAFGIGGQTSNYTDWNAIPLNFGGSLSIVNTAINRPPELSATYYTLLYFGQNTDVILAIGATTNTIHKLRRTDQTTWIYDGELYHSGNTNFNEFGGLENNDVIAVGSAANSTVAIFYFPLNSHTATSGISSSGTFSIRSPYAGTDLATGLTPSFATSASSNRIGFIYFATSGLTAGQPLELKAESLSSKITFNF